MEVGPGYKLTEAGVIPADWDTNALAAMTDPKRPISYGIVQTGRSVHNGVRCLRVLDINDGCINKKELITTSKTISEAYKRTVLTAGDLVMPLRGRVGDVGLVDKELEGANLTRGVALIALRPGWSAEFCKHVISWSATRSRLEQSMNGSALQEMPIATLRSFRIPVPATLTEQTVIAEALCDFDALLAGLDGIIAKKRHLKQAAMQQLLTGQTRLPGFRGEIQRVRLDHISTFITKGATPTTYGYQWERDGVLFLRSECVSESGLDLGESMFISEAAHRVLCRSEVRAGDVLITITGNVGRVVYLDDRVSTGNINQHIARIRVIESKANAKFVYQMLSFAPMRKYYASITTGQAYPQLSLQQVRGTLVLLPAPAEQHAIADALMEMDAEINALEARRDKTRALKQAMMQELLTGRTRLV